MKNFKFCTNSLNIRKSDVDNEDFFTIEGLASTSDRDLQGEILDPKGFDLSYIESGKGYINDNHGANYPTPDLSRMGIIDEAKVTKRGLYLRARVWKKHPAALAYYNELKYGKENVVQFSVEGGVVERDKEDNGLIKQAVIRGCALTRDPVNVNTFTTLVKSLTANGPQYATKTPDNFTDGTVLMKEDQPKKRWNLKNVAKGSESMADLTSQNQEQFVALSETAQKGEKMESCVQQVQAQGKTKDSAWAICTASIGDQKKSEEKDEDLKKGDDMSVQVKKSEAEIKGEAVSAIDGAPTEGKIPEAGKSEGSEKPESEEDKKKKKEGEKAPEPKNGEAEIKGEASNAIDGAPTEGELKKSDLVLDTLKAMYSKIKAQTAENESIKKSLKEMEAKFATLQNSYDSIKKSLEPKKEEKIEKAAQPSDEVLNILKSLKSENEELRKSQNEIVKALDRTARPRQSMSSVQPLNKSEASADPSDVRQIPYGQMMPIMEELYKSKKVTMDELIFFNTNKTLAIESVVPVQEYFSKKK